MSEALRTTLLGVEMQNPVIAASGTFGFGDCYADFFNPALLGGIASKGLTLHGSQGNQGIRLWETPSGLMNSIGLENPGVRHFVQTEAPKMRTLGPAVLANLGGHSERDYLEGAELLNQADIDILELNISCPNVKAGGMAFGLEAKAAAGLVQSVKRVTRHPLLVKLTPNAGDVVAVALACQDAGADGLSLVNTFLGMAIDVHTRRPVFQNVYAGLSGPAIRPLALALVHKVAHAVSIPVVGLGGIATAEDALTFLMAGAVAVQVGTASFANPHALPELIEGLEAYCQANRLANLNEIVKSV